jgi:phage-related tail fiber protein
MPAGFADGTDDGGTGTGGTSVYPATATASFPYGLSASTISLTGVDRTIMTLNDAYITDVASMTFSDGTVMTSAGAALFNALMPAGFEMQYISTTAPAGYNVLYEDGRSVSKTTYPALFAAIAAAHAGNGYYHGGSGDNFNIPDARGLGIRGVDGGRGEDPETYRVVGSTQTDTFASHSHGVASTNVKTAEGGITYPVVYMSPSNVNTSATGGAETRMKNRAVAFFIKY